MLPLSFLPVALAYFITLAAAAPQIQLGNTTLIGRDITGLKLDFFGGIPFAVPPLGQLRLQPPILKARLAGTAFDASNFGFACLQSGVPTAAISEDCLTINIFRPSGIAANASLPVLFWTYGGGFTAGSSSIYNGSAIVAQSVARGTPLIYVSFNYRLGPLGWPQGQEAADRKALNLGLKDQLTALAWVQLNIGLFGGDRKKVTVFGESAGAVMTSILFLNSPLPYLARGAILQSGSPGTTLTFNASRREGNWQNFVSGVSQCASTATSGHTFDCLKTANSSDIFQGFLNSLAKSPELFPFDPTLDGPDGLYPDIASNVFASGRFTRIPSISGCNLDEGTIFTSRTISSEGEVRGAIIANFSPPANDLLSTTADTLIQLYPDDPTVGSPFGTGNQTFGLSSVYKQAAALQGDLSFQALRRSWSQTFSNAGVKTYGYLFTEPQPAGSPSIGVFHSSEISFVFGRPNSPAPTAAKLSSLMVEYWVSFATSLDPNDGIGLPRPHWDQYTPNNEVLLQLNGANLTVIPDDYRKAQIDFINSRPAVFHHRREGV